MSYTELFKFNKNGNAESFAEVENAWRGAMAVWKCIEEEYLLFQRFSRTMSEDIKEIWNLAEDERVSLTDRICILTTFDRCLVKKEELQNVIAAFRKFKGKTSLKEQADLLEKLMSDDDCIAVGWNQTSVNGDSWKNHDYNEEKGKYIPYNCLSGESHFWLFDELEEANHE